MKVEKKNERKSKKKKCEIKKSSGKIKNEKDSFFAS